jgi:hypothetical protein
VLLDQLQKQLPTHFQLNLSTKIDLLKLYMPHDTNSILQGKKHHQQLEFSHDFSRLNSQKHQAFSTTKPIRRELPFW